jgi:threonine synthase
MFYCPKCGEILDEFRYDCPRCGGVLLADYRERRFEPNGSGIWRYQSMLPVAKRVSLGEGNTPLVRRRDVQEPVFMKLEGDNPTGSFKDRGVSVVISHARALGFETATVASTGNMGASVAAYCAYANMKARIFIPKDVPEEKVLQMRAYGAELVEKEGDFSDIVRASVEEAEKGDAYLASTGLNPLFLEGLKTVGLELFEQMGVPDWIVVPTGTGGLLTAIFKGFRELRDLGFVERLPRMVAVQARTCSPIVDAWLSGKPIVPAKEPRTIASAILVKSPFNGGTALSALRESKGLGVVVDDRQIVESIRILGEEGVFAEPASAAALAALSHFNREPGDRVALVITGSGLKDPDALLAQ